MGSMLLMLLWLFLIFLVDFLKNYGVALAVSVGLLAVFLFVRDANKREREREQNGQVEMKTNVAGWTLLVLAVILLFLSSWSHDARLY